MPAQPLVLHDQEFHLWPDNVEAWLLFVSLRSQWRIGVGGSTGLDYAAVLDHLRAGLRLSRRKIDELYPLIVAAEGGALQGWAETRKEEKR